MKLRRYRIMKKTVKLLLAVLLLMNVAAVVNADKVGGTCGSGVTWEFDSGILTISGTGAMDDYTEKEDDYLPWMEYRSDIRGIVVENGVTAVGDYAFAACTSAEVVQLPDTLSSVGKHAFEECYALSEITIPSGVVSVGEYAFSGSGLADIVLPDGITKIEKYTFESCRDLLSITIPENVTVIDEYAFYNCVAMKIANITGNVTEIGKYAFYNCKEMLAAVVPATLKTVQINAFQSCSKLAYVYYNGTAAEWDKISVNRTGNNSLKNAANKYYFDHKGSVTEISADGKSFLIAPSPFCSEVSVVVLALYKGGRLIETQHAMYTADGITFTTNADYDCVKVFLWGLDTGTTPLAPCEVKTVAE